MKAASGSSVSGRPSHARLAASARVVAASGPGISGTGMLAARHRRRTSSVTDLIYPLKKRLTCDWGIFALRASAAPRICSRSR